MQIQPHCSYFLFVNASSGGGVGKKLIQQQKAEKITLEMSLGQQKEQQDKKKIDVYFYNLRSNIQKGFKALKTLSENNYNLKVIICGGDGTVIWVVSQMHKYNIDTQKTPLGIIPLGTGNDFSQHLGWGNLKLNLTQKSFAYLKKVIRKWQKAKISHFDIWDVKAQIHEHGKFQKVQEFKNKTIEGRIFQRSFCNYFSFGMDGKIGYSFDLHRTQSRFGNLAMYGLMGMLKAMTKTKKMNDLIHGMQIKPELDLEFTQQQQKLKELSPQIKLIKQDNKLHPQPNRTSFIFKTKNSKKQINAIQIKNDYYNIVALNINSFMGGVFDIWKNAKVAFKSEQPNNFTQMDSGDGKLQFVSFASSVGMAAERSFGGFAQKMTQGAGPYYFQFKQYDPKQKHRTYFQVDGQFIRFCHPKSVTIRKSKYGKNGKVKVLQNIQIK